MIFRKHRENGMRVKALEIVYEHSAFTQPLTVELTPQCLAPACLGNGEVQAVTLALMPATRCQIVAQCILVGMLGQLRISGGAGCDEVYVVFDVGCLFCPF